MLMLPGGWGEKRGGRKKKKEGGPTGPGTLCASMRETGEQFRQLDGPREKEGEKEGKVRAKPALNHSS